MNRDNSKLIAVVGPTACGKTRRGVEIAEALDGEIISGDSRQVYRGMDIGTGKDLVEYGAVPYHLIDLMDAGEKYDLHKFLTDANSAIDSIKERGKQPILCGGTGMYIEAVLNGLILPEVPCNPELRRSLEGKTLAELTEILKSMKHLHNKTDVDTIKRALRAIEIEQYYTEHPEEAEKARVVSASKPDSIIIGLDIPREIRRRKITERLTARLKEGMVQEVETLLRNGVKPENLIYYGLEYKFVTLHVIGELSYDDMFTQLETAIHQFAKRQMTWFRGMERRGHHINWVPYNIDKQDLINKVRSLLQ